MQVDGGGGIAKVLSTLPCSENGCHYYSSPTNGRKRILLVRCGTAAAIQRSTLVTKADSDGSLPHSSLTGATTVAEDW